MFGFVVLKPEALHASIAGHGEPFRVSVHENQNFPQIAGWAGGDPPRYPRASTLLITRRWISDVPSKIV
jgi:hypothetical protein